MIRVGLRLRKDERYAVVAACLALAWCPACLQKTNSLESTHSGQFEISQEECDRQLSWQSGEERQFCQQQFEICQKTTSLSECTSLFAECIGQSIMQRDRQNQLYSQCMEHYHGKMPQTRWQEKSDQQARRHKPKKPKNPHKPGKIGRKCYKKCEREVDRCEDRTCRKPRKKCLKEAEKEFSKWLYSLKDQLGFCLAQFEDDPANLAICIEGVLTGAVQPNVTLRGCWEDSIACGQACIDVFDECLFQCL